MPAASFATKALASKAVAWYKSEDAGHTAKTKELNSGFARISQNQSERALGVLGGPHLIRMGLLELF